MCYHYCIRILKSILQLHFFKVPNKVEGSRISTMNGNFNKKYLKDY